MIPTEPAYHAQSDFIVLVDFDETLFKTGHFRHDLWQLLAGQAGLSIDTVQKDSVQYFADPVLGGYDFAAHATSYNLDPERLWQLLDNLLTKKNYLYEDSAGFIQNLQSQNYDVSILSFGEHRFQQAKITSHLKYLDSYRDMRYAITMQKKNSYIAEKYAQHRGVLIDDVPNQQLPDGFTEIQIDRASKLNGPELTSGVFRVSSLDQARLVLHSLA